MAKQFKNSQFLIIVGSEMEFTAIGFGVQIHFAGRILVCDNCNNSSEDYDEWYYVPVLNRVFCKKCFEKWNRTATYFSEDAEYEHRYFEGTKAKLEKLGLWED
jgi:hypothetical protein